MNIVLLGIGIGMLTLIPPGPVTLSLVQVGARLGRRPALRGALGIMGGDSLLGLAALAILAAGATLPATLLSATQLVAAALLFALGLALVLKPRAMAASVDRIERPTRAFFLLTSLTPTVLGGWVAMLAAMPFAHDLDQLARFTVGVLIASYLWHPGLGLLASSLGTRLTERGQIRLSRCGGAGMSLLGAGLASANLL